MKSQKPILYLFVSIIQILICCNSVSGNDKGTNHTNINTSKSNLDVSLIKNASASNSTISAKLNQNKETSIEQTQSYSVVINSNNKITSLTKKELRLIFLGRKRYWTNKKKLSIYHLDVNSGIGKEFLKSILRMTPEKFQLYWTKKVFSGYSAPPTEVKRGSKLLQHIADIEGGIGIVLTSQTKNLPQGCKVIQIN